MFLRKMWLAPLLRPPLPVKKFKKTERVVLSSKKCVELCMADIGRNFDFRCYINGGALGFFNRFTRLLHLTCNAATAIGL